MLAVVTLVPALAPASALARLDRRAARCRARLGGALQKQHGIAFHATLDEPVPVDLITGMPLEGRDARPVPGFRNSGARRFDGRKGESLVAPVSWSAFQNGFSAELRVRFHDGKPGSPPQRLIWDRGNNNSLLSLRVADGMLEAGFRDAEGDHLFGAPFAPTADKFVHLVYALGPEGAALWTDGKLLATATVTPPLQLPPHRVMVGTDWHEPPRFDLDEWTIRSHLPSAREISRAAAGRLPLAFRLEPLRAFSAAFAARQRTFLRTLCTGFGRLRPGRRGTALLDNTLPHLDLEFSRSDKRHFRNAATQLSAAGFLGRDAARTRKIALSFGGRTETLRASLAEPPPEPAGFPTPSARRPAFLLRGSPGFLAPGSGLALLFPPEQWAARHPDALYPLPLDPALFVRVSLSGEFLGIYCLEAFDRTTSPWMLVGEHGPGDAGRLFHAARSESRADGAGMDSAAARAAFKNAIRILGGDSRFPWGSAEARWRAALFDSARATADFAPPQAAPLSDAILGKNPARFWICHDLNLPASGLPEGTTWVSSRPDVLSPDGTVRRPSGNQPVTATLSATLPDGSRRELRFRVMPERPSLPALFLHVSNPLRKIARADFTAMRIPADGNGKEGRWSLGTVASGGGAKLRGNTSYLKGAKRSINLEFDEPVDWAGSEQPVRHVLLLCGYADPTRLRNALCFDAFKVIQGQGAPRRSAPVSWTEVFVNGEWAGVWEFAPRMQDVLEERFSSLYKVRSPSGLWERSDAEMVDRADTEDPESDLYEPFRRINAFVAAATPARLAESAREAFDLAELGDFFTIVNFSGNEDGRVTNQFLGQREDDERWLAMPWDYDKTFLPSRGRNPTPIVSPLVRKLIHALPDFLPVAREHWRAARAGALGDAALDDWIDAHAARLAPYMEEEWRLLKPLGFDGDFSDAVEILRREVHLRAAWLDRWPF